MASPNKFGLFLFSCILPLSGAQETADSIDVMKLLKDALYLLVDVDIRIVDDQTRTWENRVEKITVPGRPVEVNLYGENSHLKVGFTLYPAEKDRLLLVAKSETWVDSEYLSALTSLSVGYRDAVYYYPLGRPSEPIEYVDVRMTIKIIPYLDTLSKEDLDAIESALDSTARLEFPAESAEIK